MITIIARVFIVIVVFLAGTMVGNIYMPQKRLEQTSLVAVKEPQTSINLESEPNIESTSQSITQMEAALSDSGMDPEVLFSWSDTMQRTVLIQAYKAAKNKYEIELLKAQENPTHKDAFLKAKNNYFKIVTLIEKTFPPLPQEVIEIIPAPAAQPKVTPAEPEQRKEIPLPPAIPASAAQKLEKSSK